MVETGVYPCSLCGRPMSAPDDAGCAVEALPLEDGTLIARVRYGAEEDDWGASDGSECGDCGAPPRGVHHFGCDVERCGRCGGQFITCDCPYTEEFAVSA